MSEAANPLPEAQAGIPPRLAARRAQARIWWMIWGGVLLACGGLLFFFNPALHGFYPRCAFYQLTGCYCPGCGGLRALHQLLHGHLLTALKSNGLAVLGLPLAAWWVWRQWAHDGAAIRARWVWWFVAALLVFGVARNLPGFGWLAP